MNYSKPLFVVTISFLFVVGWTYRPVADSMPEDEAILEKIFDHALSNGQSETYLRELTKDVGPRLSGSKGAARGVNWGELKMKNMQLDGVHLQEVMVPNWKRGPKEKAYVESNNSQTPLNICALGGSIGTGKGGIQAKIVEVKDFETLGQLGREKVEGRIVFYNRSMRAQMIQTFRAYGGAVNQRSMGAVEASKFGAVGTLVRSMTLKLDDNPHTGGMRYSDEVKKIPSAAISTLDANLLSELISKDPDAVVNIDFQSYTAPDTISHNVIGEIKGSKYPDKIILIGGHLDSWDLGEGAHDDGAGIVHTLETLRLLKAAGIKPNYTIRGVLFMNEENGLRGGLKYAEEAKKNNETYLAAIESDRGGFTPKGFTIQTSEERLAHMKAWESLFEPYGGMMFVKGGGGADIGPLRDIADALIGYMPDSQRYFDFHHAATDVFEQVNKRELELGSAMICSLVYLLDKYGLE